MEIGGNSGFLQKLAEIRGEFGGNFPEILHHEEIGGEGEFGEILGELWGKFKAVLDHYGESLSGRCT